MLAESESMTQKDDQEEEMVGIVIIVPKKFKKALDIAKEGLEKEFGKEIGYGDIIVKWSHYLKILIEEKEALQTLAEQEHLLMRTGSFNSN